MNKLSNIVWKSVRFPNFASLSVTLKIQSLNIFVQMGILHRTRHVSLNTKIFDCNDRKYLRSWLVEILVNTTKWGWCLKGLMVASQCQMAEDYFHFSPGFCTCSLNPTPWSPLPPPPPPPQHSLHLGDILATFAFRCSQPPTDRYLWFCLKSILSSIHWSICVGGFNQVRAWTKMRGEEGVGQTILLEPCPRAPL